MKDVDRTRCIVVSKMQNISGGHFFRKNYFSFGCGSDLSNFKNLTCYFKMFLHYMSFLCFCWMFLLHLLKFRIRMSYNKLYDNPSLFLKLFILFKFKNQVSFFLFFFTFQNLKINKIIKLLKLLLFIKNRFFFNLMT